MKQFAVCRFEVLYPNVKHFHSSFNLPGGGYDFVITKDGYSELFDYDLVEGKHEFTVPEVVIGVYSFTPLGLDSYYHHFASVLRDEYEGVGIECTSLFEDGGGFFDLVLDTLDGVVTDKNSITSVGLLEFSVDDLGYTYDWEYGGEEHNGFYFELTNIVFNEDMIEIKEIV